MVPEHLKEVRDRRRAWIEKARAAVKDRLTKEIGYWDHRAEELKVQEQAGRPNARLNSQEARRRADDLQGRLQKRMEQLDLESQVSALPPVALGGLVVVPAGLMALMTGHPSTLHLWWARRPLAAARAVIFAQMVDDPSSHPDIFRTEKAQEKERQRLFKIIEDLVKWENTTNEAA